MPKAVISDVDGTLIDSVDLHAKAWVDAFHDFGHEVGFEDVRSQIGKGGDQLLPVFLSEEEVEEKGEALEEHRGKVLKERYLPHVTAFLDVRALFQRLIADGKRTASAASSAMTGTRFPGTTAWARQPRTGRMPKSPLWKS